MSTPSLATYVSTVATTGSGFFQPASQLPPSSPPSTAAAVQTSRVDLTASVGAAGQPLSSSSSSLASFGGGGGGGGSNFRVTHSYVGDSNEQQQIIQDATRAMENAASQERERQESWSWGITAWNVIALVLCPGCLYCMFGALLCNVFAYVDHRTGHPKHMRRKLMCAIGWSVGAFVGGIVAVIVALAVLFAVYDAKDWNSIPTVPGSDFFM